MRTYPPCAHKVSTCLFLASIVLLALPGTVAAQSVQPTWLRFHDVNEGQSKTMTVMLTNNASSTLQIATISSSHSWFSVSGVNLPYSLAAGQTLALNITFFPQAPKHIDADILIGDNGSPIDIPVHGTGVTHPWLTVSPASLNFGNVPVGTKVSKLVTVTNAGQRDVTISQDIVSGPGFTVSGLTLPLTLAPQHSVTFTVTFSPTSSGTMTGNDALTYDQISSSIPLSGSASGSGQLAAAPSPLNLGSVVVGQQQSATASLSASGASVTVTAASVNSSEFAISGLSLPITIPAGQSKTYTVVFTPQSSGSAAGVVKFTSNATNAASESVAGSGTPAPAHSVSLAWSDSGAVSGYNVYRAPPGGSYAKINAALEPVTNFTDATVQGGQTYYYVATSVGTDGVESQYSPSTKAVIPGP